MENKNNQEKFYEELNFAHAVHSRDHGRIPELMNMLDSIRRIHRESDDLLRLKCNSMSKKAQCAVILSAVEELVDEILSCLQNFKFTAAEALARISVEHSVNLMYIFEEKTNARSRSFVKHYFDSSLSRLKKWHAYGVREKISNVVLASERRLRELKLQRGSIDRLDNATGWPDAKSRFISVGLEGFYHEIFAPASDSVHTLAEDAYNRIHSDRMVSLGESAESIGAVFSAEKASYATYLGANAVLFYGVVLRELMLDGGGNVSKELLDVIARMEEFVIEVDAADAELREFLESRRSSGG